MTYKLPPLPFAVFDEFGNSCEDRVRDHFIEAIEAQGVPDVDDLRDRLVAISSAVAEQNDMLAQALIGDTLAMLASTPPAPQADKYVPCPHCGKNTASDNPSQWCPCPKQASVVQQEPVGADRDAQVAELERELEKEKQYVKEMTKDRDHWMTVAAERALLLDKNRKVNKPLSDYEFDEIG